MTTDQLENILDEISVANAIILQSTDRTDDTEHQGAEVMRATLYLLEHALEFTKQTNGREYRDAIEALETLAATAREAEAMEVTALLPND